VTRELLRLTAITKRFGGIYALRDVSLNLAASTIVGIAGPNGAGKTTLLEIISGFENPDDGRVMFRDVSVKGLPPWDVAALGMTRLFQEVRLAYSRTALDNMKLAHRGNLGEHLFGLVHAKAIAAFEHASEVSSLRILSALALEEKAGTVAGELSYGQQKLLALACCVATRSTVYLLDEPFAGLAPGMRQVVGTMCGQLRARGDLVIVVEHDIDALRLWADRLIVIAGGRVVGDGVPMALLEDHKVRSVLLG